MVRLPDPTESSACSIERTGRVLGRRRTDEPIGNSFAVDKTGGVFVVTDGALYRFDATRRGLPRVSWRARYRNIGVQKPGQLDAGSGTTPTLMGSKYVSITDNADPMRVVVYRREKRLPRSRRGGRRARRLVCQQPVFSKGAGATDNSLIGTGRSMIVENNYGYAPPPDATSGGRTTVPGIERVDINRSGRGCHTVWKSQEISPSTVPKLSLANGLVYAYTKPPGSPDAWYLTAVSFRTGKTVWRRDGYGTVLQRPLRRARDQPARNPLHGRAGRDGRGRGRVSRRAVPPLSGCRPGRA